MDDIEVRVVRLEDQSADHEKRLSKCEETQSVIIDLTKSVAVMAQEQKYIRDDFTKVDQKVDKIGNKLDEINQKPAKRWESLVDKAIAVIVGGIIGFMLVKLGIG